MLKRKKIISLCCVLILLISTASPSVLAAAGDTRPTGSVSYPDTVFSVDSMVVDEGTTVQFTVSVKNNHGICGYNITLGLDNSVFTVPERGITRGSFTTRGSVSSNYDLYNSGENPSLTLNYFNTSGESVNDGTLCIITLIVKDANVAGTYPISLSYSESSTIKWDADAAAGAEDSDFPKITDIQCVGGTITVNHVWDEGVKVHSLTIPDPDVQDTLYTC